jgi:hypothetical protein
MALPQSDTEIRTPHCFFCLQMESILNRMVHKLRFVSDIMAVLRVHPRLHHARRCCLQITYLEDEMGGACGAHGGGERCIQHFDWEA